MQQAIYNSSTSSRNATLTMTMAPVPAARPVGLARRMAGRWDLAGVLALMAASAAYGVFALAHLGL